MKRKNKLLVLSISLVLLCLSCTQSAQTYSETNTQATKVEETATYIPLFTNNSPFYPSFGLALNNLDYLDQAAASGTYWVHYNGLLWSDVQPNNKDEYNWDDDELKAYLVEASASGMEVILTIRSTPGWAQKYDGILCGPMKQEFIDEFASFMNKVVERYSVAPYNVMFYEIWNEPDSFVETVTGNPDKPWGCWGEKSDPYYGGGYYAEMLKQVYPAVKEANPNAQVVLGGLLLDCDPRLPGVQGYCENPTAAKPSLFLKGILANGGGAYFDFLNYHAYNYFAGTAITAIQSEKDNESWEANGGQVEGKLDYLLELQAAYEIDKPVLITEIALLTDAETPSTDFQEEKADYVVYVYARNLARGIAGTTWYTLESPGWRNSGLLQDEGKAYDAYSVLVEKLTDYEYVRDLSLGSGIIGFEYENSELLWVLFSEDGTEKTISTPDGYTAVYDMFGIELTVEETITFARPIYIKFSN